MHFYCRLPKLQFLIMMPLLGGIAMLLTVQPLFAQRIEPGGEPIPTINYDMSADKSILIPLHFEGPNNVTQNGTPHIEPGLAPGHLGDPPLLKLELIGASNVLLQTYNAWDPRWQAISTPPDGIEFPTFIPDPITVVDVADTELILPFRPDLRTLRVRDPRQQDALLIEVDIQLAIDDYCAKNAAAQECADGATVFIWPPHTSLEVGETKWINLGVRDIVNLYGNQVRLSFDPTLIKVNQLKIRRDSLFNPDFVVMNNVDNSGGEINFAATLQGNNSGASGNGILLGMEVEGVAAGTSPLTIAESILSDPASQEISTTVFSGEIVVQAAVDRVIPDWGGAIDPGVPDFIDPLPLFSDPLYGLVELERRTSNAGSEICLGSDCQMVTGDGAFTFSEVLNGNYTVAASRMSYLRHEQTFNVSASARTVSPITLLGGDINQNDQIWVDDAVLIGLAWNSVRESTHWDRRADINDDAHVNVLDMVAVQFNWRARATLIDGVQAAASPESTPSSSPLATQVVISPSHATIAVGDQITVAVAVQDVTDLYGFDFKLSYDPTILKVVDTDFDTTGTQMEMGDFLDPFSNFVLVNSASNISGTLEFAATQLYPALSVQGDGTLIVLTFEAIGKGNSAIRFSEEALFDDSQPSPIPIAANTENGLVTVEADAPATYLPLIRNNR